MSKSVFNKARQGFTLIELLVVIGILAILLAITLIAINPSKHFQDSRNAQRSSNVSAILNAIYEYESANNGNVPPSVANVLTEVPISMLASPPTPIAASATTFANPALTYTVTGNTITSGTINVTGCTDTKNNGTFAVTSGTATSIVVNNSNGSAQATSTCSIKAVTAANLCDVTPTFLADLPMDPSAAAPTGGATPCATGVTAYDTGYTISKTAAGRFTVTAPKTEGGGTIISVTR